MSATITGNALSLHGQTIMITGAAQGIGRSVAQLAASYGARLALLDQNGVSLERTASAIAGECEIYVGSVTDPEFVEQAVDAAVTRFGALNGLFNNAGIIRTAMIHRMSQADWKSVVDVNLTGAFNCLQAVGRHMIERNEAGNTSPSRIVNVSSIAGRRGTIGQINYSATKAGVLGLTMSAAREWARYNISVNSICFGAVETQMTEVVRSPKFIERTLAGIPMGRIAPPEEIAIPCCFLLSNGASYITGQHLSVDGGAHVGF
jgi:3-oxoacyl-[acyl-carrier protein] reductase